MSYKVEFSKAASKQFKKLSENLQERIQIKIDELVIAISLKTRKIHKSPQLIPALNHASLFSMGLLAG